MRNKSILCEAREIHLATELVKLGARLQLLESETHLSRDFGAERLEALWMDRLTLQPIAREDMRPPGGQALDAAVHGDGQPLVGAADQLVRQSRSLSAEQEGERPPEIGAIVEGVAVRGRRQHGHVR